MILLRLRSVSYTHLDVYKRQKEDIINMMVGRVIYEDPKEHSMVAPDAPVVLKDVYKRQQQRNPQLYRNRSRGWSSFSGSELQCDQ